MRERVFSPCGEKLEAKHGYIYENGVKVFTKVGETDVCQRIRAAGLGSSLYEMIEKYQKTGDDSFLYAKAQAFVADLTAMPKNLIELYNLKSTAAEDFKKFPVDFRALFNHNVDDYFKSIQDNTIEDKMKSYFESKGKTVEKPLDEKEEKNE